MSFRPLIVASAVVAGGMALVSALALAQLPPGTMLPTHWNAAGQADRFAEAGYALFLPVVLTMAVSAVMAALPRIEPLQRDMAGSAPLLRTAWAGMLALFIGVEAMVAGPALGWTPPDSLMLVGLGLFLIAIGNTLPKSRPGFFVGIRTPWTISDTDNWIATHRFGAWLFAGTGLGIVIVALLPISAENRGGIVMTALLSAVLTPVVFSYCRWRMSRPR
ncbi:SdpI family protein [Sphingomonas fuzhouensis]|uniref:SdpI family protein n=1 Tax=Sphingomonas fuzhouensis TaxID=3106033 RepID=UPI002AFEE51D|nr:SdpI family protein [Sphingomonas sp. SGZ-02]